MNKKQIINGAKVITLALVFSIGVHYAAAQSTWTPPTSAPPAGNTFAPLNVGSSGQVKDGGLTLGYTLPATGTGLLVPTGMVGFGTTQPNTARNARLTIGQTETNTKGSNSLISFQSLPGTGYYHITRLGTDHSLNFDSFAGGNTWVTPLSLLPNGQVRLSGGSPAVGKVLTATDTSGTATWQTVPIGRTSGTINDQESLTTKVPAGYALSECTALVSPRQLGVQQSDKAIDYITASFVGGGTVTCKYSWEDDGTLYAGTCNYMLICTK